MYPHVDQFAVDKALNTLVEEGIAPLYIREYYARRGRKCMRVEKNLGDLAQSRLRTFMIPALTSLKLWARTATYGSNPRPRNHRSSLLAIWRSDGVD
jgi:hypothetical protein